MWNKDSVNSKTIFLSCSRGLESTRDAWVYNFSRDATYGNIKRMIKFYNDEVDRYQTACRGLSKEKLPKVEAFVNTDKKKISWSSSLLPNVQRGRHATFRQENLVNSLYRPFSKQWLYFDSMMNHRVGQWPRLFPTPEHKNIVFSVTGIGASKSFSALITNLIPQLSEKIRSNFKKCLIFG